MQETKRCSRCGDTKALDAFSKRSSAKDGRSPHCRVCDSARQHAAYLADPERAKARVQAWREANPGKRYAGLATWHAKNPGKLGEYNRTWAARNGDHIRARERARYAANPGKSLAKSARWNKANRDGRRELNRLRYARRKGVKSIKFTKAQLEQRMAYYGNRCWICGGPREAIDHVKPITKGGAHMLCNLRPICNSCNSRKRNRWPFAI